MGDLTQKLISLTFAILFIACFITLMVLIFKDGFAGYNPADYANVPNARPYTRFGRDPRVLFDQNLGMGGFGV